MQVACKLMLSPFGTEVKTVVVFFCHTQLPSSSLELKIYVARFMYVFYLYVVSQFVLYSTDRASAEREDHTCAISSHYIHTVFMFHLEGH